MWRDIRFQIAVFTLVTTGVGAIVTAATATKSVEGRFTFWLLAAFMCVSFIYVSAPIWSNPARDARRLVRRMYQRRRDRRDFQEFRRLWAEYDSFVRKMTADYLNPPHERLQRRYAELRRQLQVFRAPVLADLYQAVKRGVWPELGGTSSWAEHVVRAVYGGDNPFAVFYSDPDIKEQWRRLMGGGIHGHSYTPDALRNTLDRVRDVLIEFGASLGLARESSP